MDTFSSRLCLWSGPLYVVLFGIGFWPLAGLFPPPSPSLSAEQVAAFYQSNTNMIRLGVAIVMVGAGLQAPWIALIAEQMKRIRGCPLALVYTQLGAGCAGIVLFIMPCIFWLLAAFRPERDVQTTLLLNDLSWLSLVTPVPLAMVQVAALAVAILLDKSARPVFPRWAGFYNLWLAVIFLPGVVAAFFKSGPFAWNGIFPFWIPASVFFSWFIVMFFVLRKALRQQEGESAAGHAVTPGRRRAVSA
jgi:hypothetical protein